MSPKGQILPLAELRQRRSPDISCAQAPVGGAATKAPIALVFELPQAKRGARILSTSLGHSRSADQDFWHKRTYPRIELFVSRRIQKTLNNRLEKGMLVMHDVQNVGKVPLGLNNRSSAIPEGQLATNRPCPADLSAFDPRNET